MEKIKILFVCTGNICRSPMAEGYFRDLCEKSKRNDIEVASAGTFGWGAQGASTSAVKTMADYDIDISKHKSQALTEDLIISSDLIVVMTRSHRETILDMFDIGSEKLYLLHEFDDTNEDVPDPIGGGLDTYKKCFSEMKDALDNLFLDIEKLGLK